jgi:unsaturated rhamnogalacturonyl hydrolase
MRIRILALGIVLFTGISLRAAELRDVGLAQNGTRIEASIVEGATGDAPLVVLIGGLDGPGESSRAVEQEIQRYERTAQVRRAFRLIAIALANPARQPLVFPPAGVAYRENAESHLLWRWIGVHAPDQVVVAGQDFGLISALGQNPVGGMGRIPAARVGVTGALLTAVGTDIQPSQAHTELNRRIARSPKQVADELATVYGHDFDQLTYLPGMALIAQLRLGNTAEVVRLASPYLDSRDNLARANSLTLAGHLVFAELAERTKDNRYTELVRKAANTGFTDTGVMKESMPYHEEMSDSLFMATPLLAKAGKLTGDKRYFDMAARHVAFMQKLVLRADGLYRHSPLTDAAWSRGNAFPALGLALALSDFPADHPEYANLVASFVQHMNALAPFQDEEGMWRQVIDFRGSYPEFSSTAMIATSILRGIRNGWLEARTWQPRVDRAWRAIVARVGADGVLMDVCESTNKQPSLDAYLKRAAILGRDPRGGGMALIFATEVAGLK